MKDGKRVEGRKEGWTDIERKAQSKRTGGRMENLNRQEHEGRRKDEGAKEGKKTREGKMGIF